MRLLLEITLLGNISENELTKVKKQNQNFSRLRLENCKYSSCLRTFSSKRVCGRCILMQAWIASGPDMFIGTIEHDSVCKVALVCEYHIKNEVGILVQQCHDISPKCYLPFGSSWMQGWGHMNFSGRY